MTGDNVRWVMIRYIILGLGSGKLLEKTHNALVSSQGTKKQGNNTEQAPTPTKTHSYNELLSKEFRYIHLHGHLR